MRARHFVLAIDGASCNATMRWKSGTGLLLPEGAPTTGTPTPLLSLYNRVSDNRATNMDACTSVSVVAAPASSDRNRSGSDGGNDEVLLRVSAAHGYGYVDVAAAVAPGGAFVTFTARALGSWTADPTEKHLAYGEWWAGLLDNASAPIVMGRLQGPRATPGPAALGGAPSAGFLTLSRRGYYRYVFYAEQGDALAFTACPTPELAGAVRAATPSSFAPSPQRFDTWLWSGADFSEATRAQYAAFAQAVNASIVIANDWDVNLAVNDARFPRGLNDTAQYLAARGLKLGLHMHPDIVYPCADPLSLACFATGSGTSPIAAECPDCLVPEGLAPTYRNGDAPGLGAKRRNWTEDLGFWWCHDRVGAQCLNGNAKPCGQGACTPADWNETWGVNMTLHGSGGSVGSGEPSGAWSKLGAYRRGGSAAFDGTLPSYAEVRPDAEMTAALGALRAGLTLGLVAHVVGGAPAAGSCLAALPGVFALCFGSGGSGAGAGAALSWEVQRADGTAARANGTTLLAPGRAYVVKATYNTTSRAAHLFVNNRLDSGRSHGSPGGAGLDRPRVPHSPGVVGAVAGAGMAASLPARSAPGEPIVFATGFKGALEELYLKNVSTENRLGYMYADQNRKMGTYLLDLTRAAGRARFAALTAAPMALAPIAAVQYDGFEKLQLIAGQDFAHSSRTWDSGAYRGYPTPDWYHFEGWPLRWGLGVLQGMADAHAAVLALAPQRAPPATEASFMAPGLGPWRPDMAPYVDERGPDLVGLGLEWHAKLLQRIELTMTLVNAYNTRMSWVADTGSAAEADYWFGGLVTGGVAPQPAYLSTAELPSAGVAATRRWLQRYRRWGHVVETGGVHTLVYDAACCHVQGDCEFVACNDTVFATLVGGTGGTGGADQAAGGLVLGSPAPATVPPALFGVEATAAATTATTTTTVPRLLLFQTRAVAAAQLTLGAAADERIALVLTSPVVNSTLTLAGGFLHPGAQPAVVWQTVTDANGTLVSRRTLFDGRPVAANASYTFKRADEAPGLPPPIQVLFEKEFSS
eukprot:g2385.t1